MSWCRHGHSCHNVKIGTCRYRHAPCPRGMNCSLLQSQECSLLHSEAEHRVAALTKELKCANTKIEEYECSKSKIVELKQRFYQTVARAEDLSNELEDMKSENQELIQKNNGLTKENANLRQSLNGTILSTQSLTELHKEQDKLMKRLGAVHFEIQKRHESNRKCIICRDNDREMFILPCRHETMCQSCSQKVAVCPVCKAKIQHSHRIILS